jgi:hypothetical protein
MQHRVIETQKISYVVDADIKGFFDNVNHDWLMKFIGENIADPNIKRPIVRFLKAEIVRYGDDYVCCFQYKKEAEIFFHVLKKRLAKFGLELAENKSKILEFGRFAASNSKRSGKNKPETFVFLGFTHYCSTSKRGRFRVKRRTIKKKFNAKIVEFTRWIKLQRNMLTTNEIIDKVKSKLKGHYQYYGITDNYKSINKFRQAIIRILFKWLNRRSQREIYLKHIKRK